LKRQSAFLQIALSVNLDVAYEYTQIYTIILRATYPITTFAQNGKIKEGNS
jgi:hypothetical protein